MSGCHGRAVNLRRHFGQCHKYLSRIDRENILKKYEDLKKIQKIASNQPVSEPGSKGTVKQTTKYYKQCAVCDKTVRRIDVRLTKLYKLKRGTAAYRRTMNMCTPVTEVDTTKASVKVASGTIQVTVDDPFWSVLHITCELALHCRKRQ